MTLTDKLPQQLRRKTRNAEFAVIGLGRFGGRLARRLAALNCTVLGIDTDMRIVQDIADEISDAVVLDATSEEALADIDITAFGTVVVTMVDDFEACALTTISLKRMGVPNVIGVVHTERHKDILLRIGADRVIQPIHESGDRLAYDLAVTGILESISLGSDLEIVEVTVPHRMSGLPIASFTERQLTILAVLRNNQLFANPPVDMLMLEGDILVVVGEPLRVEKLVRDTD
jgi:trk system potassium uptake protein